MTPEQRRAIFERIAEREMKYPGRAMRASCTPEALASAGCHSARIEGVELSRERLTTIIRDYQARTAAETAEL